MTFSALGYRWCVERRAHHQTCCDKNVMLFLPGRPGLAAKRIFNNL
jgi:hypothetical protein